MRQDPSSFVPLFPRDDKEKCKLLSRHDEGCPFIIAAQIAQAESDTKIIVIPSDWEDYTYSEQQSYLNSDVPQMRDETYSEAVHRQMYFEEDMRLKGIDIGTGDD